jgi:hypothetical protein
MAIKPGQCAVCGWVLGSSGPCPQCAKDDRLIARGKAAALRDRRQDDLFPDLPRQQVERGKATPQNHDRGTMTETQQAQLVKLARWISRCGRITLAGGKVNTYVIKLEVMDELQSLLAEIDRTTGARGPHATGSAAT